MTPSSIRHVDMALRMISAAVFSTVDICTTSGVEQRIEKRDETDSMNNHSGYEARDT